MGSIPVPSGYISSGLMLGDEDIMTVWGVAFVCTVYDGGQINVKASGTVLSCTAQNGGEIYVSGAGQAEGIGIFNSGAMVLDGGNGYATVLRDGGSETIKGGGSETKASVQAGGVMFVDSGLCRSATVFDGGQILASGTVRDTSVSNGGIIRISSGGNANTCQVDAGGMLEILSSGFSQKGTVLAGGRMRIFETGSANSTTIGGSGTGSAVLEISGGYVYNTAVNSGGVVTFDHDEALRSATIISGGSILGGDLVLSRTGTSNCRVIFEGGGTAVLSNLTIKTGGLMQVDSGTAVHFRDITLDGNASGFTMAGLDTYDPVTGTCRKLLDCTAETTELWTDAQYRTLLNTTDAVYDNAFLYKDGDLYLRGIAHVSSGATGDEAFATVASALAMSPTALVIEDGVFDSAGNIPTFEGVTTTINGGSFTTSVCGGKFYREPGTPPESMENIDVGGIDDKKNISLTINGGTFDRTVFAGDRVDRSFLTLVRTGDLDTTIEGGTFNNAVSGAMAVTVDAVTILNKLVGNVTLTIRNGTFNDPGNKGWIYGGSVATSKTVGATTTIDGSVTVTLDATNNAIEVANLVAGSYGYGKITGNTNLVLKGANSITASGEIWGGCSGDVLLCTKIRKADDSDSGNREVTKMVSGKRILTFTGFGGAFTSEANKIRAFSDVEVKGNSDATVANSGSGSVNFSDVVNWTFEKGSKLTGNFINDFNGDTLNLTDFNTEGTFDLLIDSNLSSNDIFNAFDQLTAIKMDGNAVEASFNTVTNAWEWGGGSSWLAGSLEVNRSTGKMTLATHTVIA